MPEFSLEAYESKPGAWLTYELSCAASTQRGPSDFTDLFKRAVTALELDDDTAAGWLMTSSLTIRRWKDGRSKPHALAQPAIFLVLHRLSVAMRDASAA